MAIPGPWPYRESGNHHQIEDHVTKSKTVITFVIVLIKLNSLTFLLFIYLYTIVNVFKLVVLLKSYL